MAKKEERKRDWHPRIEPKWEEGLSSVLSSETGGSLAGNPYLFVPANRLWLLGSPPDNTIWHYNYDPDTLERNVSS